MKHYTSGEHEFDQLCQALGIEHRLTKPRAPQTNGMVERFNGRIAEVLATRRYDSAQDLETTLLRHVWLYNHHLPQKALGHRCPMDAMKQWYTEKPHLFSKIPRNRPGPDTAQVDGDCLLGGLKPGLQAVGGVRTVHGRKAAPAHERRR